MEPLNITLSQLSFATSTPTHRLTEWHGPITRAMNAASINTPKRCAAFLANAAHETGYFTRFKENLNYTSAERLMRVWPNRFKTVKDAEPFVRNPTALADKVYGGRMGNVTTGDGARFLGRGIFQLTGRANYAAMTDELTQMGVDFNLLANPDTAAEPEGGSWAAAAFWRKNDLNDLLDVEGFEAVRRRINGGSVGLAECKELYKGALNVLGPV